MVVEAIHGSLQMALLYLMRLRIPEDSYPGRILQTALPL